MPIRRRVGANLKAAREAVGLTQMDLATRLQTEQTSVSRWESGRVLPSLHTLTAIAEILGHDLSWFYADHSDEGRADPEPKAAA